MISSMETVFTFSVSENDTKVNSWMDINRDVAHITMWTEISTKASGVTTKKTAEEYTHTIQLVKSMKVSGRQVSVMVEESIISLSETPTMDSKNKNN